MSDYPILQQFNRVGTTEQKVVSPAVITAAATIAPVYGFNHITGATSVVTITAPWDNFQGEIALICDSAISWTAGGNIATAGNALAGAIVYFVYDTRTSKFYPAPSPGVISGSQTPQTVRVRTTTANVNTGATLLAAVPGLKYRLIDMSMIAIGGNAATATTVDIKGTQAAASVKLFAVPVASLTQSAVVKPGTVAATGPLADGACFVACDVNTAITIGSTTNNLATATNIDTILTFVLDT